MFGSCVGHRQKCVSYCIRLYACFNLTVIIDTMRLIMTIPLRFPRGQNIVNDVVHITATGKCSRKALNIALGELHVQIG